MRNIKKTLTFLDADNHRATLDIEIKHNDKNKSVFSMSGSICGYGGQCQDEIKPLGNYQTELLDAWKNYHLNNMRAGTPKQEKAIKDEEAKLGRRFNYDMAREFLTSINLLIDNGQEYGGAWYHDNLPEGFDDTIDYLINNIEAQEKEKEEAKELAQANEGKTDDDILLEKMSEEGIDDDMLDACRSYLELMSTDDLADFSEAYAGQFDNDEEFSQDLAEQIGAIDRQANWPNNCIDWEMASREIMNDYVESDGFYFRNL